MGPLYASHERRRLGRASPEMLESPATGEVLITRQYSVVAVTGQEPR
jgi:hypothetical protein